MDGPNPDYGMLVFNSSKWPVPIRLQAWRDILRRKLLHAEVDPLGDEPFEADANVRIIPEMRFGWGKISASINRRTRSIVSNDNNDYFMVVNLDDTFILNQRRREFVLRAGDAHVMPCSEEGSYVRPKTGRILCVRMAHDSIKPLVPDLDDNVLRVVPRENEALQLLSSYVSTLDDRQSLTDPTIRNRVVSHVCDLAALSIGMTRDGAAVASRRGLRAARLKSIKDHIGTNLGHRSLSVATVASAHGLTERYVQRLFETEGTTFTNYVLECRLTRMLDSLGDRRRLHCSVSELAYEMGFGDISYFNRAFRRRFGATPSDVRSRETA